MLKFFEILFLFYVYVYLACMYPCVTRVCSAHGGQERAVGALDLELQPAVSCHVSAGNGTWVFWKNSQCS